MGSVLMGCASARNPIYSAGDVALVRTGAVELKENMRKFWSDHVLWTREYIVLAVANDPSASVTASRLMKNQEDIGNAIAPYYGSAAGAKLTTLLKDHINIATEVVTAAKANNTAGVAAADARWRANARDIADFLSSANPNWSRDALLMMLNTHLDLTTQEAVARIDKRSNDSVRIFDQIYDQAIHMADTLTDGIIKQFPSRV
jgi:hypothetical protein